jgi:hypothetical protein
MDVDSSVSWQIANPEAILIDDQGTVWHAGCVRDVIRTVSGETIVATDTGGVWSVSEKGIGVSLADWDKPNMWCLAQGPNGDQHLYAGGDALYETDVTAALPFLTWRQIPLIDNNGGGIGKVYRTVALRKSRNLVLATSNGVYWSSIPAASQAQGCLAALLGLFGPKPTLTNYNFQKVQGIPEGRYLGLAEGPNDTVAVAYWGDDNLRADILHGGWKQGALILQESHIQDELIRLAMFGTTLASCADHPDRMYGVSSDVDGLVSVVLRSDNGGIDWTPIDPVLDVPHKSFKELAGNQGNDANRPCNCIAVAPHDAEKVAIGWRNAGIFISTSGAQQPWHHADDSSPHVHSDLHTVYFDPRDDRENTVYIGGDGGLVLTRDLGHTYESYLNRRLLNLQFQSWPAREFYGTFCPSPQVPGLIAGGLQDNGNVSCMVEPSTTPWRCFARQDDGLLTQFVQTGHSLYYFNDDDQTQDLAWDMNGLPSNHTYVPTWTPNGPEVGPSSAIVEPVRSPSWKNRLGQLMYAVAVKNTVVFGFFSDPDGSKNHWESLADFGVDVADLSAVGSADGSSVFVGTSDGKIFELNPSTRNATQWGVGLIKAPPPGGAIYKIVALTDDIVFATFNVNSNGYVLRKQQNGFTQMVNGLPDSDNFLGLEVIQNDQVALFAASDSSVYVTRDNGASWQTASTGLPVRPHCCDIRYVLQQDANAFLYLSTFGRSVWVAQVQFGISVTPR